ncbi:MAG: cyclase family protein [Bacillota bacterium]
MGKKLVDLSMAIEDGLPSDPPGMIPQIQYILHEQGAESMKPFFPGLAKEDLPGGLGWALELLQLSTHSGTHLDAPWHYHPTMDGGAKALTIEEVPLEWCMGDGVVLDFRHFPDGYLVKPGDIEKELNRIGHQLKPLDIVLVMTGADKFWGRPEYLIKGCGVGKEATLWLLERGVRVTGTDAWSWDRPLPLIAQEYMQTKDPSIIWEGHFAGIEKGYCHIEKLTSLESIPQTGFTFFCFPVKVKNASGGWIRAVALIED